MPTRFLWSVWSKQLVCFVHWQGQEREQKHTTKKFVRFYDSSLLTMVNPNLLVLHIAFTHLT